MRYDPGHKARIRTRLLEEAAKAIRTEGPDRLGVADVMRRAGLTHGGFYAHFSSKDELVSEALDLIVDARRGFLNQATASAPPREALRRVVSSYLSVDHRDSPETGCPIPILAGEHGRLPKAASRKLLASLDDLIGTISDLLEKAAIPDALDLAQSAACEMIGAMALARLGSREQGAVLLENAVRSVFAKLQIEHD